MFALSIFQVSSTTSTFQLNHLTKQFLLTV